MDMSPTEFPEPPLLPTDDEERRFRDLRGALQNLVSELRANQDVRRYGLKISVALNVAERALRQYPTDRE